MKKGFTLIELLFVMAIIAILTGFGIGVYKHTTNVAHTNSVRNDLKNAIAQQQTYFSKYGAYFCCHAYETDIINGTVLCSGTGDYDLDPDGNQVLLPLSKGNSVWACSIDCGDGTISLYANVTPLNMDYYDSENNDLEYDGCSQGTIQKYGTSPNNPF